MARFQCLEEGDYTDFELERQILSSEYKAYKSKNTEERRSSKYDGERYYYGDRYKEKDREREGRRPRREKYREQRETRPNTDRYKGNEGTINRAAGYSTQTKKKEGKGNGYNFDYPKRERKQDGVIVRPRKEQDREKYRDARDTKLPKKRVTLVEKHFGDRLYHSDSEIDLIYTRAKSANSKLNDSFLNKQPSARAGYYGNEYQGKEQRRHGNEERGKNKYKKYYNDRSGKGSFETFAMKRAKTKSSPELRESSSAEFLDRSADSGALRKTGNTQKVSQKENTREGVDSRFRPYPRDSGFRAKMFQLLIQHVKDLTKEVQNHKEENKQLKTQIIVLQEESKALKEKVKQPESMAFKKRQTKKLDETFSALRDNHSGFSKNPSFKQDLRNILAEVQGKYYAQLREHEIRIQEVQEKAEYDIQELMKNIVEKYVKVTEIKERQQQIEKIVGNKKTELASNETKLANGTNRNDDFSVGRSNILPTKSSQNASNTETNNAKLKDRERPYQFYFPENRVRLLEKYKSTEQSKGDNVGAVRNRPTNFGTALLENEKTSPTARLKKSPGAAAGSPVASNTYEYWHSRLTQGAKGKGTYIRNTT